MPAETLAETGRRIPVVRLFWEQVDWVRFPTARPFFFVYNSTQKNYNISWTKENKMSKISFHILRVGLAITFFWIGFMILEQPEAWGSYVAPWVADLLPIPIVEIMIGNAIFDIAIGPMLLLNIFFWLASFVGAVDL